MEKHLADRYCDSRQWVFLTQVRSSTGSANRVADAMAFNMYGSTGYEVLGFEIKVSRSDFLAELKDMSKSDELMSYCDKWYLVVPDAEIVKEVRLVCPEAIICASTSGRIHRDFRERSAVLGIPGIDMASLTVGSVNFKTGPSINSYDTIKALLSKMLENRVKPELECFEIGHVQAARRLEVNGWYNLFLGIGIEADAHWYVS